MRNITVAIALMAMAMVPCLVQADGPGGEVVNLKIHVANMATVSSEAGQIDLPINQRDQFAGGFLELNVSGNHDFDVYLGVYDSKTGLPWSELYEGVEAHVIVSKGSGTSDSTNDNIILRNLIHDNWVSQPGSGPPNPWPGAYVLDKGVHYPVRLDNSVVGCDLGADYVDGRHYIILEGNMGNYDGKRVYEYRGHEDEYDYRNDVVDVFYAVVLNSQYGTNQAVSDPFSQVRADEFDLNFLYTIQDTN